MQFDEFARIHIPIKPSTQSGQKAELTGLNNLKFLGKENTGF
jgi:hypothetical protein